MCVGTIVPCSDFDFFSLVYSLLPFNVSAPILYYLSQQHLNNFPKMK